MSYVGTYQGLDGGLLVEEPIRFFSGLGSEDPRHPETPRGNQSPLRARLYLVSLTPPDARGNNSEKRGIRAGIIERSPAGIDAVTFSDVTEAENGRGWGLGRSGDIFYT
jgi:hypothetical protein